MSDITTEVAEVEAEEAALHEKLEKLLEETHTEAPAPAAPVAPAGATRALPRRFVGGV